MATYQELHALRGHTSSEKLKQKIVVATAIKANLISKNVQASASAKQWAVAALANPDANVSTLLAYILADYNTATVAVITEATDAQVQTAVNAAVDTLLGA